MGVRRRAPIRTVAPCNFAPSAPMIHRATLRHLTRLLRRRQGSCPRRALNEPMRRGYAWRVALRCRVIAGDVKLRRFFRRLRYTWLLVMCGLAFCAAGAALRSSAGQKKTFSVTVAASQVWTDTKIDLKAGEKIRIMATGTIRVSGRCGERTGGIAARLEGFAARAAGEGCGARRVDRAGRGF